MGVPAKLTERQIKFSELLVYNEGRKSPAECARESGYISRPRQAASELRNPRISPLVVRYIGELRTEVQEKYGINTLTILQMLMMMDRSLKLKRITVNHLTVTAKMQ